MSTRAERFFETLGDGVPRMEVVLDVGSRERVPCSSIDGVGVHRTGQPVLPPSEAEVARFAAAAAVVALVHDDGSRVASPAGSVDFGPVAESGSVVVVTDRRIVGTLIMGHVMGRSFDSDHNHKVVCFEIPHDLVDTVALKRQKRLFGGVKDSGFLVHVLDPLMAGVSLDVVGTTTLDLRGARVRQLGPMFDGIVKAIAHRKLVGATGDLAAHLARVRDGERADDGSGGIEAVFSLEDAEVA